MGWIEMRLIPSVCMLALAVSACAESGESGSPALEARPAEIDAGPFAGLETADCQQIRATMRAAVSSRAAATQRERAGDAGNGHAMVFSVVTAFVPIPGLGLLRRVGTAAAQAAEPEEPAQSAEAAESAALYRAAQASYRDKGCGAERPPGGS